MSLKTCKWFAIAVAACWAISSSADAAQIGVNFTESPSHGNQQIAPTTTAGSGLVTPQQNWNNVTGVSGGPTSLVDSSGVPSGVTVEWGAAGVWGDGSADVDAGAGVGDAMLLRGYLDDHSQGTPVTVEIDLSGITYAQYDVLLIGSTDGSVDSYTDAVINGNTYSTTGPKSQYDVNPALDASRVWVASGQTGSSVSIEVLRVGGDRGSIAGLQIVEVPEPASIALGSLAALFAVGLRRRS